MTARSRAAIRRSAGRGGGRAAWRCSRDACAA